MNSARYLPRRFASWYVLFTSPSPNSCILWLGLRISFVMPRAFSVEVRYAERFHCSAKCCFFFYRCKQDRNSRSFSYNKWRHYDVSAFVEGTGSRFSTCSLIKVLFFCWDMLYRLWKQYNHVVMLSKNQSAHSPGSHLINLGGNSCKLINHGIKPSGQQ